MKILIIKMSSLGDVVHCLPVIDDIKRHFETLGQSVEIDWVVEEGFADIVRAHAGIHRVIPVAIRRWRSDWRKHWQEVKAFRETLKSTRYDYVIDAQGLLKSALVGKQALGKVYGLDRQSAREPAASWLYQTKVSVEKHIHAVQRLRILFSKILAYDLNALDLSYGLSTPVGVSSGVRQRIMMLHGTTWASKHWPDEYWQALIKLCVDQGMQIVLPHGSDDERQRAENLATTASNVTVLPRMSIEELLQEMGRCQGFVSVDTGLGHLAVALNKPLVGIYGSTNPNLTGFYGPRQELLSPLVKSCVPCLKRECQFQKSGPIYPPCYQEVPPEVIFKSLLEQLQKGFGGKV